MMKLPFSTEEFLTVLAQYNEAVWPMQLVLHGAVLACVGLLFCAQAPLPRVVFIVPLLWSVIGALAAVWLDIAEDIWLLGAGAAGIAAVLILHVPTDLALHSNAHCTVRPREGV